MPKISKEHGLGDHLAVCVICGERGLVLIGNQHEYKCHDCGKTYLGEQGGNVCPICSCKPLEDIGEPSEREGFFIVCGKCKKQ